MKLYNITGSRHYCTLLLHNPTDPTRILQTLLSIQQHGYGPVVIFLNAYDAEALQEITDDDDEAMCVQQYEIGQQLVQSCGHCFHSILECGTDRDEIVTDVERIIEREVHKKFWVPIRTSLKDRHPLNGQTSQPSRNLAPALQVLSPPPSANLPTTVAPNPLATNVAPNKVAKPAVTPKPQAPKAQKPPPPKVLSLEEELKKSLLRRNSRLSEQYSDDGDDDDTNPSSDVNAPNALAQIQQRVRGRADDQADSDNEDGHVNLETELKKFMQDTDLEPEVVASVVSIETTPAGVDDVGAANSTTDDFGSTLQALDDHHVPHLSTSDGDAASDVAQPGPAQVTMRMNKRLSSFGAIDHVDDGQDDDDDNAAPPPPPSNRYSAHESSFNNIAKRNSVGGTSRPQSSFSTFGGVESDSDDQQDTVLDTQQSPSSSLGSPLQDSLQQQSPQQSPLAPSPSSPGDKKISGPNTSAELVVGAMYDTEIIDLAGGGKGYGFKLEGGTDKLVKANGDASIYVTNIVADGVAAVDGRLRVGDRIIEANGVSFIKVAHETVVKTIRSNRMNLKLKVTRTDANVRPAPASKIPQDCG